MTTPMAMIQGAARFALISVVAFAIWAFGGALATVPLYTSITAVFLALSGILLRPLAGGGCRPGRFHGMFAGAFLAYAALWCLGWFGIKGHAGEIFGSAAGLAACTAILLRLRGTRSGTGGEGFLSCWAVLFLFHTLGYVAGGWIYYAAGSREGIPPAVARLAWGLGYGLGFGAGLGYVLRQCRQGDKR